MTMVNLESFKNLYEVRKTVRFWLNQPNKKSNINKTHWQLKNLVDISFERETKLINNEKKQVLIDTEKALIEKLQQYVNWLEVQLKTGNEHIKDMI